MANANLIGQCEQQSSLAHMAKSGNASAPLQIKDVICGTAYFPNKETVTGSTGLKAVGFQGNECRTWQTFRFNIDTDVEFSNANTSIALLGISNNGGAGNQDYTFKDIQSAKSGNQVIVTGDVLVGDSDGYLNELSYVCVLT